jgi:hypothetical protein
MAKKLLMPVACVLLLSSCNQGNNSSGSGKLVLGSPQATVTNTPDTAVSLRGPAGLCAQCPSHIKSRYN